MSVSVRLSAVGAAVALTLGCSGAPTALAEPGGPVPGPDTSVPFPIDRGDEGSHTPGTYKGLPLRLVKNVEPVVTPLDGVIGVVCIGMSNANRECGAYLDSLRGPWAGDVNAQVRAVNCAVGGHAIERWNDPADDAQLWDACIDTKLATAGIRPDQVRVIYHKAANQYTTTGAQTYPPYPATGSDYDNFLANLAVFATRVPQKFPSVQAVYTTSRSYGGFALNGGRGEPLSYEEGHALNTWLRQNPRVGTVWYGWGPYIWAPECGTGDTNGTGMCYVRADFVADGVHPSASGEAKIARALHPHFRQHAWYRR